MSLCQSWVLDIFLSFYLTDRKIWSQKTKASFLPLISSDSLFNFKFLFLSLLWFPQLFFFDRAVFKLQETLEDIIESAMFTPNAFRRPKRSIRILHLKLIANQRREKQGSGLYNLREKTCRKFTTNPTKYRIENVYVKRGLYAYGPELSKNSHCEKCFIYQLQRNILEFELKVKQKKIASGNWSFVA